MAAELPDPTPAEARALILGCGIFWACWGVSAVTFFVEGSHLGLVAFFLSGLAGLWLYFGGVFHVAARQEGTTMRQLYFRGLRRPPWKAFKYLSSWNWMRALLPGYFRRCARTLGWAEEAVLGLLATLLATDLVIFIWIMLTAPTRTRS